MTSDPCGELLGKAPQLLPDGPVQLGAGDRLVERGTVVPRLILAAGPLLARPVILPSGTTPLLATVGALVTAAIGGPSTPTATGVGASPASLFTAAGRGTATTGPTALSRLAARVIGSSFLRHVWSSLLSGSGCDADPVND